MKYRLTKTLLCIALGCTTGAKWINHTDVKCNTKETIRHEYHQHMECQYDAHQTHNNHHRYNHH